MPCLGPDIKSIFLKNNHKFNIYTTKRIGYELIKRLQEMHEHNLIHRDLKPDNILLGNQQNPHKVYLVDLGLASSYRRKALKRKKMY